MKFAATAAAACAAVLPVCEAFIAPVQGDARQAVQPGAASAQPSVPRSCSLSGGVAAAAACAVVAGAAARASNRPARRSGVVAVRAEAVAEEVPVKMSASVPYLTYPEELEGWVGGEKGFDPLRTSDIVPMYYLREAELKHGRICMLATLGWITTDVGMRFPAEIFQNVGPVEAHDAMVKAGIMQQMLSVVGVVELFGFYLLNEAGKGRINRAAGDFFIGKNFLPSDPEKKAEMQLKEIENGRLAMLAFSGIVTQAVLFPESHFPYMDFSGVAQIQYDGIFADLALRSDQTTSLYNPMMWFKQ